MAGRGDDIHLYALLGEELLVERDYTTLAAFGTRRMGRKLRCINLLGRGFQASNPPSYAGRLIICSARFT